MALTAPAPVTGQRFRSLIENVSDDQLHQDLARFNAEVFERAARPGGSMDPPQLWRRMNELHSHMGTVLRKLHRDDSRVLVEAQRAGDAGVREWASLATLDAIDFGRRALDDVRLGWAAACGVSDTLGGGPVRVWQ